MGLSIEKQIFRWCKKTFRFAEFFSPYSPPGKFFLRGRGGRLKPPSTTPVPMGLLMGYMNFGPRNFRPELSVRPEIPGIFRAGPRVRKDFRAGPNVRKEFRPTLYFNSLNVEKNLIKKNINLDFVVPSEAT